MQKNVGELPPKAFDQIEDIITQNTQENVQENRRGSVPVNRQKRRMAGTYKTIQKNQTVIDNEMRD